MATTEGPRRGRRGAAALVAGSAALALGLGACGSERQAIGDGVVVPDPNNPGESLSPDQGEVQVTAPGGPAGGQPAATSTTVVTRFRLLATLASQSGPTEGLPPGGGRAVVTLDTEAGEVCLQFSGVTPTGAVSVNRGASGATGPAVVAFPRALDGSTQECASAPPDVVRDVNANPARYYLSVPTAAGPLRGQLVGNAPAQGAAPDQGGGTNAEGSTSTDSTAAPRP